MMKSGAMGTQRLVLVRKWEERAGRDDEGGGGVA